jgi:MFS transporter, PPP family, 3-phenylpropionic acid transporter
MRPVPQLKFGFATRLAALYAALFILGGIQLPFLPVWLKAKGLDAATIGLVLAAPMLVRVLAIPLAARTADRHDALRLALQLHFALGSESIGPHDSGVMDGRSID